MIDWINSKDFYFHGQFVLEAKKSTLPWSQASSSFEVLDLEQANKSCWEEVFFRFAICFS